MVQPMDSEALSKLGTWVTGHKIETAGLVTLVLFFVFNAASWAARRDREDDPDR